MADADKDWKPANRSPVQDYDSISVKGVNLYKQFDAQECKLFTDSKNYIREYVHIEHVQ